MRRTLAAVALAALLVLSGCTFLPAEPTPDGDPDGTPIGGDEQPPGVHDDQLTNASTLLDAHRSAVVETGGEINTTLEATVERAVSQDETRLQEVSRRQHTLIASGMSGYRYGLVNVDTGVRIDAWANGSIEVVRLLAGNRSSYDSRPNQSAANVVGTSVLETYLTDDLTVTSVEERDGRTLYTLDTTTPPGGRTAFPVNATDVRNYEATLVVDGEGRIHSMEVTADYTIKGEDATLSREYELVDTGIDEVTRPAWVDEVLGVDDGGEDGNGTEDDGGSTNGTEASDGSTNGTDTAEDGNATEDGTAAREFASP